MTRSFEKGVALRRRRISFVVAACLAALFPSVRGAGAQPVPDVLVPSTAVTVGPCTPETPYEQGPGYGINAYADVCQRWHFVYGPLTVKPGQGDASIEPITIQKPPVSGYMVRIKGDLVDAEGNVPGIEKLHLHHGVWWSSAGEYDLAGSEWFGGPIFGTGEEKTLLTIPTGYGLPVEPWDEWTLIHMVHNQTAQTHQAFIVYDIDVVPKPLGDAEGIVPTKLIWIDVNRYPITPDAPERYANPVFNVQRAFGRFDPEAGRAACAWPRNNCAAADPYGMVTQQQGLPKEGVAGGKVTVTPRIAGNLVYMVGHLHPGGLRNEVSLARDGAEKPIFVSDGLYWDTADPSRVGGPPNSWDFSMTQTGAQLGWKVRVQPGDELRINAVYDAQEASWYENMGIVGALVAPDDPHAPAAVDVFDDAVSIDSSFPVTAVHPPGVTAACQPGSGTLCLRGQITHDHLAEANVRGGCVGACPALTAAVGPKVTDVSIANFTFGLADQNLAEAFGVPRTRAGQPVRFWNLEGARIFHSITRCAEPCSGDTGVAYPLADGPGDPVMDFDSAQIGYGTFYDPASGQLVPTPRRNGRLPDWDKPPERAVRDGAVWEFTPSQPGTYTFYCRVHPFMRGAIRVE